MTASLAQHLAGLGLHAVVRAYLNQTTQEPNNSIELKRNIMNPTSLTKSLGVF